MSSQVYFTGSPNLSSLIQNGDDRFRQYQGAASLFPRAPGTKIQPNTESGSLQLWESFQNDLPLLDSNGSDRSSAASSPTYYITSDLHGSAKRRASRQNADEAPHDEAHARKQRGDASHHESHVIPPDTMEYDDTPVKGQQPPHSPPPLSLGASPPGQNSHYENYNGKGTNGEGFTEGPPRHVHVDPSTTSVSSLRSTRSANHHVQNQARDQAPPRVQGDRIYKRAGNPRKMLTELFDKKEIQLKKKGNFVLWEAEDSKPHYPWFTCAFVDPTTGEVFLSGDLISMSMNSTSADRHRSGQPVACAQTSTSSSSSREADIQWYGNKNMAKDAAAGRALDAFRFREPSISSSTSKYQFCMEVPVEYDSNTASNIPLKVPLEQRDEILLLQSKAREYHDHHHPA